jgi:3-phosphoshikimate 1-carboxyvinyltransferase
MAPFTGSLTVPGDKSISHRALIFSAFSKGKSRVLNCSPAHDVESSAQCLRKLGLSISRGDNGVLEIESAGIDSLVASNQILDAGNSGTTVRLMSGLVAGRPFTSQFDGDASLRKRTMKRIFDPLRELGATVSAIEDTFAPFAITGGNLIGKSFDLKVASAQVEACILLAGLQADGETSVSAPHTVRDHTRRMFQYIGIPFSKNGKTLSVKRLEKPVEAYELTVPSDISSAAFFMVAAACSPGSDLTLTSVGMNPGRTLIVDILRSMGASVEIQNVRDLCGEPVADINVKYNGRLKGFSVPPSSIASGIDEIPILAIAGALCEGEFKVSGAVELRHKESDRITSLCDNLKLAGVKVEEQPDGFTIKGQKAIRGGSPWLTHLDHRLAMTGLIASQVFDAQLSIDDPACMSVSYPSFAMDLSRLTDGKD